MVGLMLAKQEDYANALKLLSHRARQIPSLSFQNKILQQSRTYGRSGKLKNNIKKKSYSMQPFREWVDQATFGVCSALARPLGIPSRTVRLYFVYVSFFTLGSP